MEERKQFSDKCDETMSNLLKQQEASERALLEKHKREHGEFKSNAEALIPKPKWSRDLLNHRKIEEHLIRQHEFAKAAKVVSPVTTMCSVAQDLTLWYNVHVGKSRS